MFWAHAQWANLDSLDGAGEMKSTPLCVLSGLSELEASWLLECCPTQAALGWTHSTPWYFQGIVPILILSLEKNHRTRRVGGGGGEGRGMESVSCFSHGCGTTSDEKQHEGGRKDVFQLMVQGRYGPSWQGSMVAGVRGSWPHRICGQEAG